MVFFLLSGLVLILVGTLAIIKYGSKLRTKPCKVSDPDRPFREWQKDVGEYIRRHGENKPYNKSEEEDRKHFNNGIAPGIYAEHIILKYH